jgi:DNA (cytosine-5)-methyltransferase 1
MSTAAPPTFIDLFSGAGGLSLGFKRAGWHSLLAVDIWEDAVRTYDHNFSPAWLEAHGASNLVQGGRRSMVADMFKDEAKRGIVQALGSSRPDWVIGGPPCKGFSTVGKRDRNDPRNRLVEEFADVVEMLAPQGFLIENVLGLRDMKFVGEVVKRFQQLGYGVTPAILKAAEYGVPQLRRRVIFVGTRRGLAFKKPAPIRSSATFTTVGDAIFDLPELLPGEMATAYTRPPVTAFQRAIREGSDSLQGHEASNHPPSLVRAISFIPDGGNRLSIPPEYQPRSGFHNSYSRLSSTLPAVAVTQNMGKPSATRCIHPRQHRGLTAREGARLQTFPDWFHFQGGMVSQREQIANAVPPVLAETIARALMSEGSWALTVAEAVAWNGMDLEGTLRTGVSDSDDEECVDSAPSFDQLSLFAQ